MIAAVLLDAAPDISALVRHDQPRGHPRELRSSRACFTVTALDCCIGTKCRAQSQLFLLPGSAWDRAIWLRPTPTIQAEHFTVPI